MKSGLPTLSLRNSLSSYPSVQQACRDRDDLERLMAAKVGLGELRPCHNDFSVSNLIYDRASGRLSVIDWEMAYPNYAAFELAYHLNSWAGELLVRFDADSLPTAEQRRRFLADYLHQADRETQSKTAPSTDDEAFGRRLDLLQLRTQLWQLHVQLQMSTICMYFLYESHGRRNPQPVDWLAAGSFDRRRLVAYGAALHAQYTASRPLVMQALDAYLQTRAAPAESASA